MQIIKKKFCLQSGTQMQIMKKVLSAIRNSKADNENSTFAIRNAIKKHDTLYSDLDPGPRTLNQGKGPSIRAKDPQSGPKTFDQGQETAIRAKDPRSGPGTPDQGQGPSIRARDLQPGPGTFNQGQGGLCG